jgi:Tol biopolymer transport system component
LTLARDARGEYPLFTRAIALLTVLLVTTTGVACAGGGSDDAPGSRIAFEIELDGTWQLVTANADGSGDLTILRDLREGPGGGTEWSPDGERIASHDLIGLSVINADGTGFREVSAGSPEAGVAWSPDGGQLASLETGFPGALYVEDADGANRRLIARCDCDHDSKVAWSPDGGTIAYSTAFSISLVHPDGTGKRALTRKGFAGWGGPSAELSWSPDGKQIAFTRPPHPYGEPENRDKPMYVINTDGSRERELGPGDGPVWSPDGARIAFTRGGIVHTINRDGSGERKLGRGDGHISWSPSGTQIVAMRNFGGRRKRAIWVWNVDGSGGRQIWPRQGFCQCDPPAWQPG